MKKILAVTYVFLLCACSPKVSTQISNSLQPVANDAPVEVLGLYANVPDQAKV